jgi:hypothetical protein
MILVKNDIALQRPYFFATEIMKRSLWFPYGQQWGLPMALHVAMMNAKHKADIEHWHSLAMIEVMNRIKHVFGHGPLARITEIQYNISTITLERVRPTTDISSQERKRQIVRMAHIDRRSDRFFAKR